MGNINKNTQQIFAEKLKELMIEKGLNQLSLSKKINIPQPTINSWLLSTRTIKIDSLVIVANFFNVSTDYLLGREF